MQLINIFDHAMSFANHIKSNVQNIHTVLRKYESKIVVDDEIERSVEALRSLPELRQYFSEVSFSQKTTVFLPLNLPLYSFILFVAMPSYQSVSLVVRPPNRMQDVFAELFDVLSLGEYYPNVRVFAGYRKDFLTKHCKDASVVIFTGQYENFLHIRKECSKDTLILFNGAGHNPLVITPSADINLAVKKTLQVKLFNNGQDCAGPNIILAHSSIIDAYLAKLIADLAQVRCGTSYQDNNVIVGPLFESSSLLDIVNLISDIRRKGATIVYGGQIDINHNVMYPCVVRMPLRQLQNFTELYSPLFLVAEYDHDQELAVYFKSSDAQYQDKEMYISLFGKSDYVAKKVLGSIILKDRTIHDVERGTEEYGGYGPSASSVSYRGIRIQKPLLIPREISNFLSSQGQRMFANIPKARDNWDHEIVVTQFQETTQRIFGDQLVFAYIFGSVPLDKDRRYSDVDTFVCVHNKEANHIKQYLGWLFSIHEMFGRIPDFKYPAEIVSFAELQVAIARLAEMELSAIENKAENYDSMVWCHSLSQPWVGAVNPENVPEHWKELFPSHTTRLLLSFLNDLKRVVLTGADVSHLHPEIYEIPFSQPELSHYIDNLGNRGLVRLLKLIPFEESPVYADIVLEMVLGREFMGKCLFTKDSTEHLYHPYFRFGVVASMEE